MQIAILLQTSLLLVASNLFMTFAWYAHLRNLNDKLWWIAALARWGVALFEYLLRVPAKRIGYTEMPLPRLKILQDPAGSHHPGGVRALRRALHGPTRQA